MYVLRSLKDERRYIGMTSKLEYRLRDHNYGLVKSTKARRPLELIYTEEFDSKIEAEKRENSMFL